MDESSDDDERSASSRSSDEDQAVDQRENQSDSVGGDEDKGDVPEYQPLFTAEDFVRRSDRRRKTVTRFEPPVSLPFAKCILLWVTV